MKKKKYLNAILSASLALSCTLFLPFESPIIATETKTASMDNIIYNQLEMPIISIMTNNNAAITSNEDYTLATVNLIDDEGSYDITNQAVSIRLRGKSSLHADKSSYKLKFDKKQNLLDIGDGKGKTWGLIANHYDASLLRNLTTYNFANTLTGMHYSPNCRSVELYLNGEYEGVYLLCELVNVNSSRVNITEAPDNVENEGYLLEMSRYIEDDSFYADTESYVVKSDLSETDSIKTQQINYISDYINQCIAALKSKDQALVEQYMDVDSLVDIYIGNEIVKNVDTGWDSFYMSKDAGDKLSFGPMWDFDLALGNTSEVKGLDSWKGLNPYHVLNVNACSNPWFCYALSCDWFREMVQTRWQTLQPQIDALPTKVIDEAQQNYNSYCRNFERWDILGQRVYNEPDNIAALTTFDAHYTYLSNWIKNRTEWLTNYYNSDDFINGIFLDENNEVLSANTNMIALSALLAYGIPPAEMTSQLTGNTGMILDINKGGFADWSIQALASGFMLEAGETYEISFDYSCSKDVSTNFSIQANHDDYHPYLSDKLTLTNTLQHYETTFTAPMDDTNCAFAVSLGSPDFAGTTVTIDHIYLAKKATASPDIPEDLTAAFELQSDWGTGAICNIVVTNQSTQDLTDGWTVDFDINRPIANVWCANLISSSDGHYTLKNPDWKTSLAPGESFSLGFQIGSGDECVISNLIVK